MIREVSDGFSFFVANSLVTNIYFYKNKKSVDILRQVEYIIPRQTYYGRRSTMAEVR